MQIAIQEVPPFYRSYFDHLDDESVVDSLERSKKVFHSVVNGISEERSLHRYEEGKWSIKDVLQHVIDAERVFVYRAMRFARNDATDLSGFEENSYAADADADKRDLESLKEEFDGLRSSTIAFFDSLSNEKLNRIGTANDHPMSVRFLGYLTAAHLLHHLKVINERYL